MPGWRACFPHGAPRGRHPFRPCVRSSKVTLGGNKYRLATLINFRTGRVFIRYVMTHAEYSRKDWKQ
ncbi:MAG: type II toxin-antitoxin system HigB family toxin [Bryobacterales bacterium]|nr:type II toxin-antitoxin system HigB family toxin [Bryobacterales bacterium]